MNPSPYERSTGPPPSPEAARLRALQSREKLLELRISELGTALRLKYEESLNILSRLQDREEQSVRRSEERFRLLVESVSDYAIFMLDVDGKVVSWNEGAERITGYAERDIVGRSVATLYPAEQHATALQGVEGARSQGRSESEGGLRRKTGEDFWGTTTLTALFDEERRLLGFASIVRDLTERKGAEMALQQTAADLRRSNEELEQFAYVASHDLQEPLRKIRAFGERLQTHAQGALDTQGTDYVTRMQSAAARMQSLIDDLLTFSRVTSQGDSFAPVDLQAIARGVISDLEARIEQTKGQVELGRLPSIEGDAGQLRRLLQNLIGNALKFHEPGVPPRVRVYSTVETAAHYPARSPQCTIYVDDDGIGFDQKYSTRIFEIFQRLHGRGAYEGTGIGLAVCRKIADRHGGRITVKSAPGAGASFAVTLPMRH